MRRIARSNRPIGTVVSLMGGLLATVGIIGICPGMTMRFAPPRRRAWPCRWRPADPRAISPGPSSMLARPCSHAPAQAASQAGSPAASSAPITPESTSPAPAVASQGVPEPLIAARPSGAATTVSEPFSSTTAPMRRAAARAAPSRSLARRAEQLGELAGMGVMTRRAAQRPRGGRRRRPACLRLQPRCGGRRAALAARYAPSRCLGRGRKPRWCAARRPAGGSSVSSLMISPAAPWR